MTDLRLARISIENNQLLIQKGIVIITNTQNSLSSSTGSLISYGGISILNTSNSISSNAGGAMSISGGLSIKKDVYIGGSFFMDKPDSAFTINGLTNNRLFIGATIAPQFSITPNGIDQRFFMDNNNLILNFTNGSTNGSTGSLVLNGGGLSINNSTNSTSFTNGGALTINGGMSVNKDVYINQKLNVNSNILLNGNLFINGSNLSVTNGNLNINNNNSININSSIGSINAIIGSKTILQIDNNNVSINDNVQILGSTSINGSMYINNTTNSSNITSGGALTITGGLSVQKDVYLDKLNVNNIIYDNFTGINTSNGSLIINSGNDFSFNNSSGSILKIKNNGSLLLKGYTINGIGTSLDLTNINGINSTLNLFNSSTTNSSNTLFSIFGLSNSLNIGWANNQYGINCTSNNLYLQNGQVVLNTNGSTYINNTNINSTSATLIINGNTLINSTSNATSQTSGGALIISGGLSVNNDIFLGNKLKINADSIYNIELSTNQDSNNNTLFNIATDLPPRLKIFNKNSSINYPFTLDLFTLSSSNDLEYFSIYNTNNSYRLESKKSGNGLYKNIVLSTNTSSITLSTNGNVGINNANPLYSLDISGVLNTYNILTNTINISNTNNNSLVTLGGANISKDLSINGNLNVSNNSILNNTSISNLFTTFINANNSQINNNLSIGNNLTLGNNFVCNGIFTLNNTTNSSITSGSMILSGGISIAKDIYIGGTSNLVGTLNLSNVSFNKRFSVNETNGNLIITNINTSTNSIVLNTGGVTFNDSINVNNNIIFNSTSNNSVYIKGSLLIDSALNTNGQVFINNTTPSTNSSSGSIVMLGGLGLYGNLNMNGDFNLIGNLNVSGTVSNINSTNININDNIIVLNSGINGSRDAGILIHRYQIDNDSGLGDVVSDLQYSAFILPSQIGKPSNILKLPASASSVDNTYKNYWIKVISGFSSNQVRQIISYNGTSQEATLSSAFTTQNPSINDTVYLYYKSFVGLIYNEVSDVFALGSTVVDPGSSHVSFTSYSSLVLDNLTLLNSTNSLVVSGGISINNSTNSTSNTSGGALTIAGGVSILQDTYIGSNLYVNNVNITPNTGDILKSRTFNASNNRINGLISGLSFGSNNLGINISLHATLVSSTNTYAFYSITVINKSSSWGIAYTSIGDDLLLNFTIDNSGNVLYSTPNYSSFVSLTFKYKAVSV